VLPSGAPLRLYLRATLGPSGRAPCCWGCWLFAGIGLQLANTQIARTLIDRAEVGEPLEQLVWIALLCLGVAPQTQAASVAETYVAEDLGWRTTNALRIDLTRHVLELDGAFHGEYSSGELIERIDGDKLATSTVTASCG
jgi:ATP-binding cassette, subfamily B, bacterial